MQELYEFRVLGEHSRQLFRTDEGKSLSGGFIRSILIDSDDPRIEAIRRLQAELTQAGDAFFLGWNIKRSYSRAEIESAQFFHVVVQSAFEPAGEENGTRYDEGSACSLCGSGATRTSPLILDRETIPRRDIARTIANELVASEAVKQAFHEAGVKGIVFKPIYQASAPTTRIASHWDIEVGGFVSMDERTRAADEVLSRNNSFNCPNGDRIGLNVVSELFLRSPIDASRDIYLTKEFIGIKRGLLRPARALVVRKHVRDLILVNRLTGFTFEIAHVGG